MVSSGDETTPRCSPADCSDEPRKALSEDVLRAGGVKLVLFYLFGRQLTDKETVGGSSASNAELRNGVDSEKAAVARGTDATNSPSDSVEVDSDTNNSDHVDCIVDMHSIFQFSLRRICHDWLTVCSTQLSSFVVAL
uniref:Uncharacterized protein n=1 Tax=Parascaris equorum TaxID=6256 RepID=A0A914RKB3_PAREQ